MIDEKEKAEYTCTRVTPSMVVSGDITSSDNMLVEGPVYGNISTSANLTAKNLIVGNVKADSAALDAAKIKGNVDLDGTLAINDKTIIVGDVQSKALKLEGKVRGNITVHESALISESALLVGDIAAQFVTAQTGSRIIGRITTFGSKQDVDIESEFDMGDIENHIKNGGSF